MSAPNTEALPIDASPARPSPTAASTNAFSDDPASPAAILPLAVTLSDLSACLCHLSAQPYPAWRKA